MTMDELVERIDGEYDRDQGFVGRARDGVFDAEGLQRVLVLLRACPSASDGPIDGRLVRRLWIMPWVIEWQAQRLSREGKPAESFYRAGEAIFRELERILGMP
jgi:hypothetical protein